MARLDLDAPTGPEESPPERTLTVGRRWLRRISRVLLALAAVVLVAAIALAWRLSRGPISLDFLIERAEIALDEQLDPLKVEIGDIVLTWTRWSRPIDLRLRDVRVASDDGQYTLVELADVGLMLSRADLLRGRLSPTGIELSEIQISIERSEDGTFQSILDTGSAAARQRVDHRHKDVSTLVDDWLDATNPLGSLQRIRLHDVGLEINDKKLDQVWRAEKLRLDFRRRAARMDAELELLLVLGGDPISLDAEARYELKTREMSASMELDGLLLSDIAAKVPALEALSVFDRAADVSIDVTTRQGFQLATAELDIDGERAKFSGTATFGDAPDTLTARIVIDDLEPWKFAESSPELGLLAGFEHPLDCEFTLDVTDGAVRSVELDVAGTDPSGAPGHLSGKVELSGEPLEIAGRLTLDGIEPWRFASLSNELEVLEGIRVPFDGSFELHTTGTSLDSLQFALEGMPGKVSVARLGPEPLSLGKSSFRGRIVENMGRIELDRSSVVLDGHTVTLDLTARRDPDAGVYESHLGLGLEEVPIDWALQYWPAGVLDKVQQWIDQNISGATIGPAEVALDVQVRAGEAPDESAGAPAFVFDQLAMTFPFTGLDVQTLSPELVFQDLVGKASFSTESLDLEVAGGGFRDLAIESGRVSIDYLDADLPISIEATVTGPVETAMGALTREPLSFFSAEKVQGLTGSSKEELTLIFPLGGEGPLTADDFQVTVTGKLSDVAWPGSLIGLDLDHGELDFAYRGKKLSVRGEIDAAGVPTRVELRRTDLTQSPPLIDVDVRSRIDEAGARALGLPQQSFLGGALDLEASFHHHGDSRTVDVTADLKDLAVDLEPLGWQKPAGAPGSASLEAHSTAGAGWQLEDIEIESTGLQTSGRIALTTEPTSLSRVEVSDLRVGGSHLKGELTRTEPNGWRATVAGPVYDAQPLISYVKKTFGSQKEPAGNGDPRSLELEIDFDRVILAPKSELYELRVSYDKQQETKLEAHARGGLDYTVDLVFGPGETGYEGSLTTNDAAALLDSLQLPAVIEGGSIELITRSPTARGPYEGTFTAREFTVLEAPALVRIMAIATFERILNRFQHEGLEVKEAYTEYTYDDQHGLLNRKGRAYGPGFLMTITGTTDFQRREYNLDGTFSPASSLQHVIGKIPVINWIVQGPHKEGFLAAEFRISGTFDDPELEVNSLTALTPGITQAIHEIFPDEKK